EHQRRAILMREWQGLSYREIADELGLSQSAVETLLFRARRTLAARLRRPLSAGSSFLPWLKTALGGGAKLVAGAVVVAATAATGAVVAVEAGKPATQPAEQRRTPSAQWSTPQRRPPVPSRTPQPQPPEP